MLPFVQVKGVILSVVRLKLPFIPEIAGKPISGLDKKQGGIKKRKGVGEWFSLFPKSPFWPGGKQPDSAGGQRRAFPVSQKPILAGWDTTG